MKSNNPEVAKVQNVILEVMSYIDLICRKNNIIYYIMGGTALGAVRHDGFIPWDDDLDIFMTPDQYKKFATIFNNASDNRYILQEWRPTPDCLEYAKVRKNGTAFIEHSFRHRKDLHQGIYVDIMILHKVKDNLLIEKLVYYKSKFAMLYALSQREWKPKNKWQKIALGALKVLPAKSICEWCYKGIYKYDNLTEGYRYCYWLTPAKFTAGLFDKSFFEKYIDIKFEDKLFMAPYRIKEYLSYRYGDYMKLPSKQQQEASVHAEIYDVDGDYTKYIE